MKKVFLFFLTFILLFNGCTSKKQEEKIKIGAILPLTGNISFIGEHFKNGLFLATKDNPLIRVDYYDSKAQPKEAVSIMNKLLLEKDLKIIITNLSSVTNAILPIVLNNSGKFVLIASITSKSDITKKSPYVFRYFMSSLDEINKMADFLKKKEIERLGVLYVNDDFGRDAFNVCQNYFHGKIIFAESFDVREKNFKSIILKLLNTKVNDLYIIGYGPVYGLLVKQLREYGYKGRIYAFSSFSSPVVLKIAEKAAEGVIFTGTTFSPRNPKGKYAEKFVEVYRKEFNKLPDHYAAYGYDIGLILNKILKTGMSIEDIRKSILALKNFNGVLGKVNIDDTGDFHFQVLIYQIKNGQKVVLEN